MKFFKNIFKNKKFEHKIDEDKFNEYQIRELKLGLKKGLDISLYENPKYDYIQMREIRKGLESGIDASKYSDPIYDYYQMKQIREGLEKGLDVSLYLDPKYHYTQMSVIKDGLEEGLDVSIYLDPRYDLTQMIEIREGLEKGLDVSIYANLKYNFSQMRQIRQGLEKGLDIDKLLMKIEIEKEENKKIQSCNCPYCNKSYTLKDGYYLCECGKYFRKEDNFIYKDEETVNNLIKYYVELLSYISKADGVVSENEVDYVKNLLINEKFNNTQINWCSKVFNKYKKIKYNKNVLFNIEKLLNKDIQTKKIILYHCMELSYIDNNISQNQKLIIDDIVTIFKIPISDYESIKQRLQGYNSDIDKYYKVLGLEVGASYDEVKKSYRRLIKIYHPDKYLSKDVSEEMLKDINEKIIKINEAYEYIKKQKGF